MSQIPLRTFAGWVCNRVRNPEPLGHYSQARLHLLERALGLFEEAIDDAAGKFTLFLIVIHLEDLLERWRIDAVSKVWLKRLVFGLSGTLCQPACFRGHFGTGGGSKARTRHTRSSTSR